MTPRLLLLTNEHIPMIDALWQACFPDDTAEDRATLIDLLVSVGHGLAFRDDQRLIGMLFWLPSVYRDRGTDHKVAYLYAIGTHPSYRRQGVAAALLKQAHAQLGAEGYIAAFLHPASVPLQRYYETQGYAPLFMGYTSRATTVSHDLFCSVEDYGREREAVLTELDIPHIVWPTAVTETAVSFAAQQGGGALCGDGFFGIVAPDTIWEEGGRLSVLTHMAGVLPSLDERQEPIGWWYALSDVGKMIYAQAVSRQPYMGLTLI